MEKTQLKYNEYLRYTFAGGIGVISYFYLNPCFFETLFKSEGIKNSLFLVLLSLVFGSLVYSIHRAIMYPICYKLNLLILSLFNRVKYDKYLWYPFISSKLEMDMDFRRWKQRQNEKSFSNNLLDWSAQIHFLYCTVWVLLTAKLLSDNSTNKIYWLIGFLFLISLINHYKSLIYDINLSDKDKEYHNDK